MHFRFERRRALIAFEWALAQMRSHVNRAFAGTAESFVARRERTHIRPFAGMAAHVSLHIGSQTSAYLAAI